MNKRVITYEEYGKLMKKFVLELQKYHRGLKFDYVYGPPRGAWPIVTHVSHHLRIPTLSKYSAYGHERADLYLFDKTLLVCDDINDTGKTFQSIDDQAPSNCKLPPYLTNHILITGWMCLWKKQRTG